MQVQRKFCEGKEWAAGQHQRTWGVGFDLSGMHSATCGGRGSCPAEDPNDEWEECETCEGTGQVGEDGDPWFEAEDDGERP